MITKNFFVCGLTGWCMEILFTSTGSFLKQDKRLIGRTSVWMFPIYGTAAVIAPLYHSIKNLPALLRGCIYSVGIFSFEYISGTTPRHVPLGLQSCQNKHRRGHTTRLCSLVDGCRTFI